MYYKTSRKEVQPYSPLMPSEGGELERRFVAKQPLIFVETTDYELLDSLIEKIRKRGETSKRGKIINAVHEFIPGIGAVDFGDKQVLDNGVDYQAEIEGDKEDAEGVRSLRHFLFERDGYEDRDLLIIRGGTRFFETQPESVDWLRMIVGNDLNDVGFSVDGAGSEAMRLKGCFLFVLVVGAVIHIPPALIPYSTRMVMPKPNFKEIERIFWDELHAIEKRSRMKFLLGVTESDDHEESKRKEMREELVGGMASRLGGFNESEIRMLVRYAFQSDNFERSQEYVMNAKEEMVARTGFLKLEKDSEKPDFGGLDELRNYLRRVARLSMLPDKKLSRLAGYGTKGILLVGMPGCGKSLAAKAAGVILKRPIIQLDVGKLLGKYVGESEANMRLALEIADRAAPCVLWIDELEKAFSGLDSSDGTALRLFGAFLTWLQEKKSQVYVIATANNVDKIPDEFKRKGRFDEIFSILLPSREERASIFKIHLKKLLDIESIDDRALDAICREMALKSDYQKEDGVDDREEGDDEARGFSGADITAIVYGAYGELLLHEADEKGKDLVVERSKDERLDGIKPILVERIEEMKRNKTTQRKIMAARRHVTDDGKSTMDGYRWAYQKLTSGGYRPATRKA